MKSVIKLFVTALYQPLLQNTFPPLNVLIPSCHVHQNVVLFDVVCKRMIMAPLISSLSLFYEVQTLHHSLYLEGSRLSTNKL